MRYVGGRSRPVRYRRVGLGKERRAKVAASSPHLSRDILLSRYRAYNARAGAHYLLYKFRNALARKIISIPNIYCVYIGALLHRRSSRPAVIAVIFRLGPMSIMPKVKEEARRRLLCEDGSQLRDISLYAQRQSHNINKIATCFNL